MKLTFRTLQTVISAKRPLVRIGLDTITIYFEYIGPTHKLCNIKYKVPQHIPVFYHNFRGYDAHHIM